MINFKAIERSFDVSAYCESMPHHKYEGNIAIRCPVCDGEGKLWVLVLDKEDRKAGTWICYRCDEGGSSVLSLIMRVEECSKFDAMAILRDSAYRKESADSGYGDLRKLVTTTLHGLSDIDTVWVDEPVPILGLPNEFIKYDPKDHPRYFEKRRVSRVRAERYNLGHCEAGYFKDRLVVPVTFKSKTVFFVARYMKSKPPLGTKKTIYPKGSKVGRVLFNYDRARTCKRIVITEDVFSAMNVGKCGVATFGTSISQYQLELLLSSHADEVVMMWDNDAIGKAKEYALRLSEFFKTRVVELPDARDPDEYTHEQIEALIDASPVMDSGKAFAAVVRSRVI